MGLPAMRVRAFPGKREEANRAGITPRIRVRTIDLSIKLAGQTIAFCGLPGRHTAATQTTNGDRLRHYTARPLHHYTRLKRMPVERSISVNGVDIAVWEWPGADPPVMFCHATGFHSRCWDQVMVHLPGRHCYALDFRGHGHSTKPPPPYPWRNFGQVL